MTDDDISRDQVEQVLAALGRIRGRRGPRPGSVNDGPEAWGRGRGGFRGGRPGVMSSRDANDGDPHAHPARDPHAHDRHSRGLRPGGPDIFGGPGGRLGGPARFRLLEALAAASGPLSVSDVAEAVGVDQPRASRLIQQAVELGMVVREPDPDDARRTRVSLTDAGTRFAQGSRGHRHDLIGTALDSMDERDRAEFVRLLTTFAAAWPES